MRGTDMRSRRIAVISDSTLNANLSGDFAAASLLSRLSEDGYGLVLLPPAEVAAEVARIAIRYAVDQLQDYAKNGYEVTDALLPQDDGPVAAAFHAECRSRGLDLAAIRER